MDTSVLIASKLSKKYGDQYVLNGVSLTIQPGEIYGLIGENGAGKTSLIKIIAGNITPTSGHISLFGSQTDKQLVASRGQMGCLIETPAIYPHLTAYQNMDIVRCMRGIKNKACIQKTLDLVGLNHVKKKKCKHFSLGMKQRLGLAIALLGDPELLILDEPTNGLDPIGMRDMRELFLRLNQEKNITILISSHILSELHQFATRYGILSNGELIKEQTAKELDDALEETLHIKTDQPKKMLVFLKEHFGITDYKMYDSQIELKLCGNNAQEIIKRIYKSDIAVQNIIKVKCSIEDYYATLIGGKGCE